MRTPERIDEAQKAIHIKGTVVLDNGYYFMPIGDINGSSGRMDVILVKNITVEPHLALKSLKKKFSQIDSPPHISVNTFISLDDIPVEIILFINNNKVTAAHDPSTRVVSVHYYYLLYYIIYLLNMMYL